MEASSYFHRLAIGSFQIDKPELSSDSAEQTYIKLQKQQVSGIQDVLCLDR